SLSTSSSSRSSPTSRPTRTPRALPPKHQQRFSSSRIPITMPRPTTHLTLLLVAALTAGCAGTGGRTVGWTENPGAVAAPEIVRFNTALADLAERMKSGLVHVRVRRGAQSEEAREDPGEQRSTGSGFIVDPSGLVVTNAHVVSGADQIQVRLADVRRVAATLVG